VIVPVRNGRHFLRKLIPALEAQTVGRDRFEVIIADDGSTDGLIDGIAVESNWLRVSHGEPSTSFAARNRGAALARSDIFAFTDADCIPEGDWLEAGVRALAGADAVAGGIKFMVPAERTVWTLLDVQWTKNQERNVARGDTDTANLFVRRRLFEELGGFETTTHSHGDYDFGNRCVAGGASLVFSGDALVHHPTRDAPRPFLTFVWQAHSSYGHRMALRRQRPNAFSPSHWLPFISALRSWRRSGRFSTLDKRWLSYNGIEPTLSERVRLAAINNAVMPGLTGTAQIFGWLEGRRGARSR
jgi:glycosyltransferase involved in cell wall biosynthesis